MQTAKINRNYNKSIDIVPMILYWISDWNPSKSRTHVFIFVLNDLVFGPFLIDLRPLDLWKVSFFKKNS
jgi:hypothetical protein